MSPSGRSGELVLSDVDGPASLAIENGPIEGSGASINSQTVASAIIGYSLPLLSGQVSAEFVLGAPLHIKFSAEGTLRDESIAPDAMGIPTGVPALGPDLGTASAAPLVLTGVYRFYNKTRFTPYAGGGLAYMITTDPKFTNPLLTEVNDPTFSVANDIGYVAQAGLETRIWREIYLGVDVKYIADLVAHSEVKNIHVVTPGLPLFETARVGNASLDMQINPVVLQVGAGMKF